MSVVTVQYLSDPTRIADSDALSQDVISLRRERLNAKRVTIRFGSSLLVHHTTSFRLRSMTKVHDEYAAFVAVGPGSRVSIDGRTLTSGTLASGEPGIEVELVIEPAYESIVFFASPEAIDRHMELRQAKTKFGLHAGVKYIEAAPTLVHNFFNTGLKISSAAASGRLSFENENVRSAAELSMADTLLSCLSFRDESESEQNTSQYYSGLVRVAEDYTLSQPTSRPTISDLCSVTNVSERTLQNAFKEIMKMSPTSFLRRLRLHRVRLELQKTSYSQSTVSTVAQNWGFWHFGDFSRSYKDCFGETPSATLRKSRRSTVVVPREISEIILYYAR